MCSSNQLPILLNQLTIDRAVIQQPFRIAGCIRITFEQLPHATMFFNASIGWFVMQYDPAEVEARIKTKNLTPLGQNTYRHSFENAIAIKNQPNMQTALLMIKIFLFQMFRTT